MLNYLKDIITSAKRRDNKRIKSYYKLVNQINSIDYTTYMDNELVNKHNDLKKIVANNDSKVEIVLPEAFALMKEVAFRTLGMRHFDVQLIGGMVLNDCMIAEMATGEGKTLMSTLPAYLNSLAGRGVHMVTVNDYLARRDSEWMGQIYRFLGMDCAYIISDLSDKNRKIAYNADITYATNNELGFDYLRDNMKFSKDDMVMRDLHYAIIDEVDSILIDEARTPLIISGQIDDNIKIYNKINNLIKYIETEDIEIDFKNKNISFTDKGIEKIEKILVENNFIKEGSSLYTMENMSLMHYLEQGVKAHNLFTKDKDYIVKDKQIVLIDEFTGRMMSGRRYADGLHQFLEAKEGVEVNKENQTLSSITFQNYFKLYDKLGGMTGTAATEAEEFIDIYGLNVMQIPTNVPVVRIDYEDAVYCTFEEKLDAIIELVKECNKRQQPILIGTASIDKSEVISERLYKNGLVHSVLNAKNHLYEATIIAKAGELGAITIATNMAGRGTDIKLGGNLDLLLSKAKSKEKEEEIIDDYQNKRERVLEAGGLYVIGTERHESRRIDNQLRGRAGRQGDKGQSKFFLSLEDDLLRIFGTDKMANMLKKLGIKNGEVITHAWITKALRKAQMKVEAYHYDIRKNLLKFDDIMNRQRLFIFQQRNNIIDSESFNLKSLYESIDNRIITSAYDKNNFVSPFDWESITNNVHSIYDIEFLSSEDDNNNPENITERLNNIVSELFKEKEKQHIPLVLNTVIKRIMIVTMDALWKDHIVSIGHLKQGIGLRSIGKQNPVNEFKLDATDMFDNMMVQWEELVITRFVKLEITLFSGNQRVN